ncbi:MAG TPA: lysophospholipid acyltransferase family protein [Gemmatimonadaceae bacterium]|nr:lysophospholipid acyltransferase family protein [Gemmatimonadaceae bacterium]
MDNQLQRASWAAFNLPFRPWMRRRVRIRIAGLPKDLPADQPVMLVANHVSWWDGFVLREVQQQLRPSATFSVPMLQRELARHPYFKLLGAVPIDGSSPKTVARAVRTMESRIKDDPSSVIAYFPQGEIRPSFARPLGFRRGLELFASHLAPLTILPVALHMEALNAASPTIFAVAGQPMPVDQVGVRHDAVQAELERVLDILLIALDLLGERIERIWPAPFEPAPASAASRLAAG